MYQVILIQPKNYQHSAKNTMMNVRTLFTITLVVCLGFATFARTQHNEGFGAGVIIGEPTGVTIKHWVSPSNAFDAAVGWSFEGRSSLHVHGDYLFHDFDLIPVDVGHLPVYGGFGARLKVREGHSDRLGVRVPLGIAYHVEEVPLEIFGEIVPILDLAPSSRVSLNAAIGVRYFFQ